jgi:hypothetical protein
MLDRAQFLRGGKWLVVLFRWLLAKTLSYLPSTGF